ncbi:MAG TPA: hypothetical protein VFN55_05620 [Solirubrobacteraceae bacterium]|nr:hypothetical protein [Solirubrobacteraceae bacterium]
MAVLDAPRVRERTARPARALSADSPWLIVACGGLVLAGAALLFRIGADAQWLAALGRLIARRHAIPHGVPFALAATGHWPNPIVLAELIFAGFQSALGDSGLMVLQLTAVTAALVLVARDARGSGAANLGTGAALTLAGLAALPSLAIARGQLFSLVLFPALALLLRSEARRPSGRIWLTVPMLALWSNLHGAALLGLGLLAAYLVFARARRTPRTAAAVGIAGALALLATPAGLHTVSYYHGVLTNVAAQRGEGMWGPLTLASPLDVVLAVCAGWLLWGTWRARAAWWELAVAAVLAVLTVQAARNGVWLVMFCAVPAARTLAPRRALPLLAPVAGLLAVLALGVAVVRGPLPIGAGPALVADAVASAHGSPVLGDGVIDEQIALAGGRIWAGNPIDAFPRSVQATYLDWVDGRRSGAAAVGPAVRVVLVTRGGAAQTLMARMPGFTAVRADARAVLYERTG